MKPSRGEITVNGQAWFDAARGINLPPDLRSVGLVFQEYALFPHMNVRKNIEYGGKGRSDELMERFRISHLANARPTQLSGGERQRVALARAIALASPPSYSSASRSLRSAAHTKQTVRGELQEILSDAALPTLVVTHDYEDAAALADRVGVIVQRAAARLHARPEELDQASPADEFAARKCQAPTSSAAGPSPAATELTIVTRRRSGHSHLFRPSQPGC